MKNYDNDKRKWSKNQELIIIPENIIFDTNISAGAVRLYCLIAGSILWEKAPNWELKKTLNIKSNNTIAKYSKELINSGYMKIVREKDENNKFTGEIRRELLK